MKLKSGGTEFEFSVLPLGEDSDGYWANTRLTVRNQSVHAEACGEYFICDELKKLISLIGLLLKGKFSKTYDFSPTELGVYIALEPRGGTDCRMSFEFLIREEETHAWGNTSVLLRLNRPDIEKLYDGLKEEYDAAFPKIRGRTALPYLLVRGETGDFRFSVFDYEFGSPRRKVEDYDDWLEISVEFHSNGQTRRYTDPALLTVELCDMLSGLEGLLHEEKGEYHSNFLEPYFVLNALRDGERFEIEAKFFNDPESDDYCWEHTETYAREICDRMEFVQKLCSLRAILAHFPRRDGKRRTSAWIRTEPLGEDGEYLYVGVSPKGQYDCNYWYIDEAKQTQADTYIWVKMGPKDKEQLVYVDSVRYCNADEVPYPIEKTKRVIRQATEEEAAEADALWDE